MISVIMLTYNREALVSRAIESILAQTYRDFEFLIVDNGSTDRSGRIAEEYAAGDERIRVIHRERGNIGSGRNAGLDAAKGDYIAFIDDDDWAEPDFLEFLLGLIEENQADVAICGAADKVFDEKKVMSAEEALIELLWRKKYNMAFPTKLFQRELMDDLRFPEDGAYDDIALMYKLLAGARRVAYHGLPKYTFYRHENNNSAWTTNHSLLTPETLEEYLNAYRTRTDWLCQRFPDYAPTWRYFEWSFMISMVEKVARLGLTDCDAQRERMARELVEQRKHDLKVATVSPVGKVSLEDLFSQIQAGEMKNLNIIVKADVQGSAEAVKASLEKMTNEEVRVRVIHCAVGAISESDVMLAGTSGAIIVGFNVRPDNNAKDSAVRMGVDMRMYRVDLSCQNPGCPNPPLRVQSAGAPAPQQGHRDIRAGCRR